MSVSSVFLESEKTKGGRWSPRRINRLAKSLNAQSYLEIGVFKGHTFTEVTIGEKTGVDPNFRFDTSEIANEHTHFEAVTSDQFFSYWKPGKTFDIIFLDGLHTFEQTYRDFCNSLMCAHHRTVWIIDDTKPNDVYSSLSNHGKALKYRKAAGLTSPAWHGDTFKVVFAIHDFHPRLNYRTIVEKGNPQTLVWQSNQGWREPRFNNLETISRLSYFDLLEEIAILRESSEQEAIDLCLKELGC